MKQFLIIIQFFICVHLLAQKEFKLPHPINATSSIFISGIKPGTIFQINSVVFGQSQPALSCSLDGKDFEVLSNQMEKISFPDATSKSDVWLQYYISSGLLFNSLENGPQYALRADYASEANQYYQALLSQGLIYEDPFIEDYLYRIINKLKPENDVIGRANNIVVKIEKDPFPNAYCLSNGLILLSTGLLTTLENEDELAAVIAHEMAHYYLDHHVINLNKMIDKMNRQKVISGLVVGLAALGESYAAIQNPNYVPGALTLGTAAIAASISSASLESFGINYSHNQEYESDQISMKLLGLSGYNSLGTASALRRIADFAIVSGKGGLTFSSSTHPDISTRIDKVSKSSGVIVDANNEFHKKLSSLISYNAQLMFWYFNDYSSSLNLVTKNINNGLAIESDYLINAIILRRTTDDLSSNKRSLELIETAKKLNVAPSVILSREEALSRLRLNQINEAKVALQDYIALIEELNTDKDSPFYHGYFDEIKWAKSLIYKLSKNSY